MFEDLVSEQSQSGAASAGRYVLAQPADGATIEVTVNGSPVSPSNLSYDASTGLLAIDETTVSFVAGDEVVVTYDEPIFRP